MGLAFKIVLVTPENISEHPGSICFINPKHELYDKKVEWYRRQYQKGLRIKLLYIEGEKKAAGFIEYTPGENCWRPVNARGYMFIHCLWTNGKRIQNQGLGSALISEVEKDAEGMAGVTVVTSDNAFMARKDLFIKKGYNEIAVLGKEQLFVKQFREAPLPEFIVKSGGSTLKEGIFITYSCQCPWVARFVEEMKPLLKDYDLEPVLKQFSSAEEAQSAPSAYGVLNIIYNGKILTDRYISTTRFANIIRKEIK